VLRQFRSYRDKRVVGVFVPAFFRAPLHRSGAPSEEYGPAGFAGCEVG
jgi:hypothetical protein